MTFQTWLAFLAASSIVLAIPGPTALIIMRYAAEGGRGRVARVIAGAVLGDATALTICNVGLGALLATSTVVVTVLKSAAAAYLIGLGLRSLFGRAPATAQAGPRGGRPFLGVFLVTALNPKGIAFFCVLLPQFVDGAQPVLPQFALLQATFCVLTFCAALTWALVSLSLHRAVVQGPASRLFRRVTGLVLIGTGIAQVTGRSA
ncbi:threonine/homoserine/homoserine lactone efflux protein [Methylorubrum rhodinum]|uniref:Threonine/homoserine/homoserine lactone efflux protein n=1 Tax=Methylorubrum rhodinum TaxID=29428 RepID=A0A840ZH40_9HYPH|nr:LysE family translocator [Methylorubrum rhodinum]MBB5756488.1 threonine/homoserine/homoserine lactone efflux protein [Methylorubrum rhodinum]